MGTQRTSIKLHTSYILCALSKSKKALSTWHAPQTIMHTRTVYRHRIIPKTSSETKTATRSTTKSARIARRNGPKTSSGAGWSSATPQGRNRPRIREVGIERERGVSEKTCEMRREHVPLAAAHLRCCLFPTFPCFSPVLTFPSPCLSPTHSESLQLLPGFFYWAVVACWPLISLLCLLATCLV
jgi:hypothetical protein